MYGRDMPGRGGGNLALPLGRGDSISLSRPPAQRMKHGRETESGRTDTQMTYGMGGGGAQMTYGMGGGGGGRGPGPRRHDSPQLESKLERST